MIWSLLLLIAVAVMVLTTRRPADPNGIPGTYDGRPKTPKGTTVDGPFRFGPGVKIASKKIHPDGKVSYRLMKEHLPTPTQRLWRSLVRLVRRPRPRDGGSDGSDASRNYTPGGQQQSAELQSFLEARRRNLSQRNSDKRGPDETLH